VLFDHLPVIVRGGGDLASGVVYRLVKAGFPVLVTELPRPLAIRRPVAFASAVFDETITVDGLVGRRIADAADAFAVWAAGEVPVLVDEAGISLEALRPQVVVDARIAKRNLGTTLRDAALVLALGPGFVAGEDCHAVIETNRGHFLGRVIWDGAAEPNTSQPGIVLGYRSDRVLRSPVDGTLVPQAEIGDMLEKGDTIGTIDGVPVVASLGGVLRGLIHPMVSVTRGMKIGDIDPRAVRAHCFAISDKSLAVGGGVVEAIFSAPQLTSLLRRFP
jgi:xanthine dehydrogenase accessory factor